MKFREPQHKIPKPLKTREVIGHLEEGENLIFNIYDFFTPQEWNELVHNLTKFDSNEDEIQGREVINFLNGALALRFIDQQKLKELRDNAVAKRLIKLYLRDAGEEISKLENFPFLNVIAVWLWPEFDQIPQIKTQVKRIQRRASTKVRVPDANDYLHRGGLALLYPNLKEKLEINEGWLRTIKQLLDEGVFSQTSQLQLWLAELLFFPEPGEKPAVSVKRFVQRSIGESRSDGWFTQEVGLHLLSAACARVALKQELSYSEAGIEIIDRTHSQVNTQRLPDRATH